MNVDTPLHTAVSKQRQQIIQNDYNLQLYLEEIEKSLGSSPLEDQDHHSEPNSPFSIEKSAPLESQGQSQNQPSKKYSEVMRGNTPPDTTNREVEMAIRHKTQKSNDANASQLNLIREKHLTVEEKEPITQGSLDFDQNRGRISSTFPMKSKAKVQEELEDSPPIEISEPPPQTIQVKNLNVTEQSFQGSARQSIGTVTPPPQGAIAMPHPIKETDIITQISKPAKKVKSKRLLFGTSLWLFLSFLDLFSNSFRNYCLYLESNVTLTLFGGIFGSGILALSLALLSQKCAFFRISIICFIILPVCNFAINALWYVTELKLLFFILSCVRLSAQVFLLRFQLLMSDKVFQKFNETKQNSLKYSGFIFLSAFALSLAVTTALEQMSLLSLVMLFLVTLFNLVATTLFLVKVGYHQLFEFFKQKQLQLLKSGERSLQHEVQQDQNGAQEEKIEESPQSKKKSRKKEQPIIYSEF